MWPLTAVRFSDSLPRIEMRAGEFDGESSLARSQNFEKRLLVLRVCPYAWKILAPRGRIFIKLHISVFFEDLSRKFKFY